MDQFSDESSVRRELLRLIRTSKLKVSDHENILEIKEYLAQNPNEYLHSKLIKILNRSNHNHKSRPEKRYEKYEKARRRINLNESLTAVLDFIIMQSENIDQEYYELSNKSRPSKPWMFVIDRLENEFNIELVPRFVDKHKNLRKDYNQVNLDFFRVVDKSELPEMRIEEQ